MQGITCGFGPGTMIDTVDGQMPIEWLSPADALLTREGAIRDQHKIVRVSPEGPIIKIDPSAFGASTDEHFLLAAAHQSMLIYGDDVALHFGFQTSFASLLDLRDHPGVTDIIEPPEQLFAVVTRQSTAIRANGIWMESQSRDVDGASAYPRLRGWETALLMQERGQWERERLIAVA